MNPYMPFKFPSHFSLVISLSTCKGGLSWYFLLLLLLLLLLLFKGCIYLILERGREGERGRNIKMWLPLEHPLLRTWPTT